MSQSDSAKKITLPKIEQISLENFDLYSHQPNIDVNIEKNIFCLIGANGLGKSTFLNTLSFAITGAIPDPSKRFQSAQDYYKNAIRVDRTEDYFNGRISEGSRSIAKVSVKLVWPNATLEVTRDIFEGSGINSLSITDAALQKTTVYSTTAEESAEHLCDKYEAKVLELTGLTDFAQFVFLMHFVFTFDESRHLLMWDDGALTNALYLAFGTDPVAAKDADNLKHEMEKEASRGRNVRFAARPITDQIDHLINILKGEESADFTSETELKAEHDSLKDRKNQAQKRVGVKQAELRDSDVKWVELSASLTEMQLEYRKLFSSRLKATSLMEHHPIIRSTLSEDICAICGTAHISSIVKAKISDKECPLCETSFEGASVDNSAIHDLKELDEKIILVRGKLEGILATRDRVAAELEVAENNEIAISNALFAFEEKESKALTKVDAGASFAVIEKKIESLKAERETLISKSKEHYTKRDKIRERLRVYEKHLKAQYDVGAEQFVPRFRELAEEFIGLPIDVELEHQHGSSDSGFGLRLRMDQQLRLSSDKLSESQRFFIDIALRMALSEFMSNGPATLFIDTPEGSLDIAYEARAGSMFSNFVASGNAIVMTANLRSSELIIRLAELQKESGMQVARMTDWTELTEVQQSEEHLFLTEYSHIDEALH